MRVHYAGKGVLLSAVVLASAAAAADGAIIYRETFGTDVVGGQQASQDYDWGIHLSTGAGVTPTTAHANTASAPGAVNRNLNASKPGTADAIGNVNAGPVVGATPAAYGQGIPFVTTANANALYWTPEYATTSTTNAGIDPTDYSSLSFKWYQGNGSTAATWRLAVKIAAQWYVSQTAFSNVGAVTSIGNFDDGDDNGDGGAAHGAELKTFNYTSDNDAWFLLTFDGDYNPADNSATTGTALALGATPTAPISDLSGEIVAFGLFSDTPGTGNRRFDTFTIEGELVPEPAASLALALLGAGPLLARRRRRTEA